MVIQGQTRRALVIVAHPDDVDVNAGGTIAGWTRSGMAVSYVVVTSGNAGGDGRVAEDEIVEVRRAEQRAAAEIVGVREVRFLEGYRDGELEPVPALVRDLVREIRRIRPHVTMIMSPERHWRHIAQGHPDHLAAGEAGVRAVYPAARNPLAFPELLEREGLEPWVVEELWVQDPPQPNHVVDVTDEIDRKIAAVRAHASQFTDVDRLAEHLRTRMAETGRSGGLPDGRLGEAFLRLEVG